MFLSHSRDVFSMLPWCVEERKVRGKPLSPGRGCPKDEAANPAPYPAGHDISAVRRMNRTVISAASQKPINPRCQRGHGRRGRRGLQQRRAVTAMFAGQRPLSGPVLGSFPDCVCPTQSCFYSNANVLVSGSFYFQTALTAHWFVSTSRTWGISGLAVKPFPNRPSGCPSIW